MRTIVDESMLSNAAPAPLAQQVLDAVTMLDGAVAGQGQDAAANQVPPAAVAAAAVAAARVAAANAAAAAAAAAQSQPPPAAAAAVQPHSRFSHMPPPVNMPHAPTSPGSDEAKKRKDSPNSQTTEHESKRHRAT